jgi:hypothetical protein
MPARLWAMCLLAGVVGACSSTLDESGSLYIQPGRYDFLKCPELAKRSMAASAREKELLSLMDRANQDPMGPVVNTFVYSTDLSVVRSQLAMLRKTAAEKNCDNLVTQEQDQSRQANPKTLQGPQGPR